MTPNSGSPLVLSSGQMVMGGRFQDKERGRLLDAMRALGFVEPSVRVGRACGQLDILVVVLIDPDARERLYFPVPATEIADLNQDGIDEFVKRRFLAVLRERMRL